MTLPSGHRRFRLSDCLSYFEGAEDTVLSDGIKKEKICIYARVSDVSQNSKGQDGKSSLTRQIDRLLSVVSEREGIGGEEIAVFKDVASSFGDREGLNRLVDAVIDGRVERIYCLYLDRLSRVPALTRLLEHICRRFGVEIVAIDVEDCEGQEVWQKELLGYITVWCNRQSAAKSILVTKREVSHECLKRMIELRQKGFTAKDVYRRLKKEGYYSETANGKRGEVTYQKVRDLLDANGTETVLTKVVIGESAQVEDMCREFIEGRIEQGEYQDRISANAVYPAYVQFCNSRDKIPQPRNVFGRYLVKALGKHDLKSHGVGTWKGYRLK